MLGERSNGKTAPRRSPQRSRLRLDARGRGCSALYAAVPRGGVPFPVDVACAADLRASSRDSIIPTSEPFCLRIPSSLMMKFRCTPTGRNSARPSGPRLRISARIHPE
jgi:hypothetical protein